MPSTRCLLSCHAVVGNFQSCFDFTGTNHLQVYFYTYKILSKSIFSRCIVFYTRMSPFPPILSDSIQSYIFSARLRFYHLTNILCIEQLIQLSISHVCFSFLFCIFSFIHSSMHQFLSAHTNTLPTTYCMFNGFSIHEYTTVNNTANSSNGNL